MKDIRVAFVGVGVEMNASIRAVIAFHLGNVKLGVSGRVNAGLIQFRSDMFIGAGVEMPAAIRTVLPLAFGNPRLVIVR